MMASFCRSTIFAAARSVASRSKSAIPKSLPPRSATAAPHLARSVFAAVGTVESLMPLHSAIASARLKSCIASDSCSWSWLSQGLKKGK